MHIEIDGYNEYNVKLAGLAAAIVSSRFTPNPVQVINIIGHADMALHI